MRRFISTLLLLLALLGFSTLMPPPAMANGIIPDAVTRPLLPPAALALYESWSLADELKQALHDGQTAAVDPAAPPWDLIAMLKSKQGEAWERMYRMEAMLLTATLFPKHGPHDRAYLKEAWKQARQAVYAFVALHAYIGYLESVGKDGTLA